MKLLEINSDFCFTPTDGYSIASGLFNLICMKKILVVAVLLSCGVLGCKKVKMISYAGVFKLNKQIISSEGWDTTWMKEQAKIYTDRYYIYSGLSSDSDARFGFGTYELEAGNTVAEHNIFNSKVLDSAQIFVVHMNQSNKGFKGVVPDWARSKNTVYKLTEDYSKVPLSGKSALDGAWELDKIYWVKGKDTIRQHRNQFKVFWLGHFIVIKRYPIDLIGSQLKKGFDYGTFSLTGNKLNEAKEMSDLPKYIIGKSVMQISFNGENEYTQTGEDPFTHDKVTEVYKRLGN